MRTAAALTGFNDMNIFYDNQIRPYIQGGHHVLHSAFLVKMTGYDSGSMSHSAHVLRNFARYTRSTIYHSQLTETFFALGFDKMTYRDYVIRSQWQQKFLKVLSTIENMRMRIVKLDPNHWSFRNWQQQLQKYDPKFFDAMMTEMKRGLSGENAELMFFTRLEDGILITPSGYLADIADKYNVKVKKVSKHNNLPEEIKLNWLPIIKDDKRRKENEGQFLTK